MRRDQDRSIEKQLIIITMTKFTTVATTFAFCTLLFASCSDDNDVKDINTNPERTGTVKALSLGTNPNHNLPDSVHINFSDYQQEGTSAWTGNVAINEASEIKIKGGKHKLYGYSSGHTSDSRTVATKTTPLFGKADTYIGEVEADNKAEVTLEPTGALVVVPQNTRIVDLNAQTEASNTDFFNAQTPDMKATYVYVKSYATNMGTEIAHDPREYAFITEGDTIKQSIEVGKAYILSNGAITTQTW